MCQMGLVALICIALTCGGCAGPKAKAVGKRQIPAAAVLSAQPTVPDKLKKRCERGFSPSCLKAAEILFKNGKHKESFDYYLAACHLNDPRGCWQAGRWSAHKGEAQEAMVLLEKACQYKVATACFEMGLEERRYGSNEEVTRQYFEMGCSYGHLPACREAAFSYHKDSYPSAAMRLFEKCCEGGDAESCHNAGLSAREVGEWDRGWTLLELACGKGYPESCYLLGTLELKNKKYPDALEWFKRAVRSGFWEWNFFEYGSDFDPLRNDPGFIEVVGRARENALKQDQTRDQSRAQR